MFRYLSHNKTQKKMNMFKLRKHTILTKKATFEFAATASKKLAWDNNRLRKQLELKENS